MFKLAVILGVIFSIIPYPRFKKLELARVKRKKKKLQKTYYQSYAWRKKRKERLVFDNYTCKAENCSGTSNALHVHHLTYVRFGNENINDLITLCQHCHTKEHKK